MLGAIIATSLLNLSVKLLDGFSAFQLLFFRSVLAIILSIAGERFAIFKLSHQQYKWVALRAVTGTLSLLLFFYMIGTMPLAAAITLFYLSPLFGMVHSIYILGERPKAIQWLFVGLGFAGAAMLKGFDPRISFAQLGLSLLGAILAGLTDTVTRKLGDHQTKPGTIIVYTSALSVFFCLLFPVTSWKMPSASQWGILLAMGVFAQIGQLLLVKAFQAEPIYKLAPLVYIGTVIAFLIGYWFFNETFTVQALFGMLVIVVAALGNSVVKRYLKPKPSTFYPFDPT